MATSSSSCLFCWSLCLYHVLSALGCLAARVTPAFKPLNHEVAALISIRRSLIDPHGGLRSWDEESVNPCGWATVTCSSKNLVIGLRAPSKDLSGTLSGSIGDLKNLQHVLLDNNNITGPIPSELGSLSKLQTLDLSNNGLSGPIPKSLRQLVSLRYLYLADNCFNGSVSLVFPLKSLRILNISHNFLSGPIGSAFEHLNSLNVLDLSCNKFHGELPRYFGSLKNLKHLYLQENHFSGNLMVLSGLHLKILNIKNNKFSGTLPEWIFSLPSFEIDGNKFESDVSMATHTLNNDTVNQTISYGGKSEERNWQEAEIVVLVALFLSLWCLLAYYFYRGSQRAKQR